MTVCQVLSIAQIRDSALQPLEQESLLLQELRKHEAKDKDLKKNHRWIPQSKVLLPEFLGNFWSIKNNLTIDDGLIVYGFRLSIPTSLRATMLSRLHDAHQWG